MGSHVEWLPWKERSHSLAMPTHHSETLMAIASDWLCFVDQNDSRWTVAIAWLKVDDGRNATDTFAT
jgi:hypothetical protein